MLMSATFSSKEQVNNPRSVLRLPAEDQVDFAVFDKVRVEMISKKGAASTLKGLVKWSGKSATLLQMDEAIVRDVCR